MGNLGFCATRIRHTYQLTDYGVHTSVHALVLFFEYSGFNRSPKLRRAPCRTFYSLDSFPRPGTTTVNLSALRVALRMLRWLHLAWGISLSDFSC